MLNDLIEIMEDETSIFINQNIVGRTRQKLFSCASIFDLLENKVIEMAALART
jgi:hypothetical protein